MKSDWKELLDNYIDVMSELPMFDEVVEVCGEMCLQKHGGTDNPNEFHSYIAHIHSEVSEAWDDFHKGHELTEIFYKGDTPKGVPIELADIIIQTLGTAYVYGIDIISAINLKLQHNGTKKDKK